MIQEILNTRDPRLRKKSKPIKKIDKKTRLLIKDMKDTLIAQDDPEGIGLAAAQVGKNVKIFLMKPEEKIITVINPKILKVYKPTPNKGKKSTKNKSPSGRKIMEGCLSLPHYYSPVKRADKVKLSYLNEQGEKIIRTFKGLKAQIVQHEIDHLNGILFVDRLLEQKKPLFEFIDGEWERVELI